MISHEVPLVHERENAPLARFSVVAQPTMVSGCRLADNVSFPPRYSRIATDCRRTGAGKNRLSLSLFLSRLIKTLQKGNRLRKHEIGGNDKHSLRASYLAGRYPGSDLRESRTNHGGHVRGNSSVSPFPSLSLSLSLSFGPGSNVAV